jgi:hypothetical protein
VHTSHPARRRGPRRRVVTIALGGAQATEIAEEEVEAWGVAQDAAAHIEACFPTFFAEHVASRSATLAGGLNAACAFFALVEQRGLELRWPHSSAWRVGTLPPEEWLGTFNSVSDEYLGSLSYWLFQPRPVYHGWNVQSHLGGEYGAPGQLTALLWQLVSNTAVSVGRPDTIAQACGEWDEEQRWDILRIPPVPACDADALLRLVARDIPEAQGLPDPALLLRYPLGATGNPLADTGDLDIDAVYEGDDVETWDWSQIDALAVQQQQARELAETFTVWRDRVERGGIASLRAVARTFHRAARQVGNEPKTLIDLLGIEEEEEVAL